MENWRSEIGDEELALIEAIHADPRDDDPRLVYADWLVEHGEPLLGQFMSWQVHSYADVEFAHSTAGLQFVRLSNHQGKRDVASARGEFDAAFRGAIPSEAVRWVRPFPHIPGRADSDVEFRRGLPRIHPAWHRIAGLDYLDRAIETFPARARMPWLNLMADRIGDPPGRILAHPALGRADILTISGERSPGRAAELIAALAETDLPDRIERLHVDLAAARLARAACETIGARTRLRHNEL